MEFDNKPISVLVVDDSEMNVDLLESILERFNYKIYTAIRGIDALEIAQDVLPEIILLDINMPKMNGYEVCRRLKAEDSTAEIPVIFISALDDTEQILEGFEAGGVDYITKPFRYREVLARVETQVTLARQKNAIRQMQMREQQQYASMDKLRRQFIGSATHDLKNPLFVISGYTDMLEMSSEVNQNEQLVGFVQSIQRGVDKMSGLVYDMLDLLQLETEVTLKKEIIEFGKFLKEATLDMRLRAIEKDVELDIILPQAAFDIQIDIQRMSRVLDNLISNAIKYTELGGRVEVLGKVEDDAVSIVVSDNGLGIPEPMLATIFQPFERVNTEEHMAQEGTGLGLSIVKTLVEQHAGTIEVDSTLGQGSRFMINLPR